MNKEFERAIRNGHYEKDEAEGRILFPKQKLFIGGVFGNNVVYANGDESGWDYSKNVVVNGAIDYVLNAAFNNATQSTSWYIGVYNATVTPLVTHTMTTVNSATYDEANSTTEFDETSREAWDITTTSSQSVSNSGRTLAAYTAKASCTIKGAFICDGSAYGAAGTVGLIAASNFSSSRSLVDDDVLQITYTITGADA